MTPGGTGVARAYRLYAEPVGPVSRAKGARRRRAVLARAIDLFWDLAEGGIRDATHDHTQIHLGARLPNAKLCSSGSNRQP